jgi:hypothetical protein
MSGRGRGRGKRIVDTKDEKKTKKKQFPVVALVTPNGIEGNLLPNGRQPLIVHLPLQSKNIIMNDMPITYDPHPPIEAQPYDIYADNPFCNDMEPIILKNSQEIQESSSNFEINNEIEQIENHLEFDTIYEKIEPEEIIYYDPNQAKLKTVAKIMYSKHNLDQLIKKKKW